VRDVRGSTRAGGVQSELTGVQGTELSHVGTTGTAGTAGPWIVLALAIFLKKDDTR
jgi:hypothetical protein